MNNNRIDYVYTEMKRNYISYKNTYNKEFARSLISNMIEKEIINKGRRLNYLGMPSLYFYDVYQWKEYIQNIACIEIEKIIYDKQEEVFNSLHFSNIKLKRINADIDNFVSYKNLLDNAYDLIYLDYWDDLISKTVNRITTIRRYVELQKQNNMDSFVFSVNHSFTPGNEWYYSEVLHLDKECSFYKICDVLKVADIIYDRIKTYCSLNGYGINKSNFVLYKQRNEVLRMNYALHIHKNYTGDTEKDIWQEVEERKFFKY